MHKYSKIDLNSVLAVLAKGKPDLIEGYVIVHCTVGLTALSYMVRNGIYLEFYWKMKWLKNSTQINIKCLSFQNINDLF